MSDFIVLKRNRALKKDELFVINVNTVTVIELVLAVKELLVLGRTVLRGLSSTVFG
jgi:hypothetical protein